MKTVVIDNEGMIWGVGETDSAALRDAYKWINNDGDFSSYDEFIESKIFDELKLRDITDDAYELVNRVGGDYVDHRNGKFAHYNNKIVMTREEYNKLFEE